MHNLIQSFRDKSRAGPVYGPFCKTSDPGIIEALGHAGFDFVILDMEHGPNGLETMQNLIRAAQLAGLAPIVRVRSSTDELISQALDIGAAGVQAPQVSSAEDVRQARQRARYAPQGMRGVCRFVRAARYSATPKSDYFTQANDALLIVQLEGLAALENLDAILAEPGIDIVFVGPYDLSQSLGIPGQVEHPRVEEKVRQIVQACRARDIIVGNFTETPEQTARWVQLGVRYASINVDMGIFYEAARRLVAELRQHP